MHEQEKRRQYEQQVQEVKHSTFPSLVMSTTVGCMGRAVTTFYKLPVFMLSEKRDIPFSKIMDWILCHLSFALLRASIMSIRGTRSSTAPQKHNGIVVVNREQHS